MPYLTYHLPFSRLRQWLHLHILLGHGLQLYHIQLTLLQFQKLQLHLRALAAHLIGRMWMVTAASGMNLMTRQGVNCTVKNMKVIWASRLITAATV